MNETSIAGEKRMTVKEVAAQLGCNAETVKGHIRALFPTLMQNGKPTYLTENQVTVILETMKATGGQRMSEDLQNNICRLETYHSSIVGQKPKSDLEKQAFTTKELAKTYGVSVDTITRHANKLFGSDGQGSRSKYTEAEATLILKSIQTPHVSGHQLTTSATVAEVSTGLSRQLRKAELALQVSQGIQELIRMQEEDIQQLKAENAALKHDNDHANGVSQYLIGLHQEHGDKVIAQYGGLPYWFDQ